MNRIALVAAMLAIAASTFLILDRASAAAPDAPDHLCADGGDWTSRALDSDARHLIGRAAGSARYGLYAPPADAPRVVYAQHLADLPDDPSVRDIATALADDLRTVDPRIAPPAFEDDRITIPADDLARFLVWPRDHKRHRAIEEMFSGGTCEAHRWTPLELALAQLAAVKRAGVTITDLADGGATFTDLALRFTVTTPITGGHAPAFAHARASERAIRAEAIRLREMNAELASIIADLCEPSDWTAPACASSRTGGNIAP